MPGPKNVITTLQILPTQYLFTVFQPESQVTFSVHMGVGRLPLPYPRLILPVLGLRLWPRLSQSPQNIPPLPQTWVKVDMWPKTRLVTLNLRTLVYKDSFSSSGQLCFEIVRPVAISTSIRRAMEGHSGKEREENHREMELSPADIMITSLRLALSPNLLVTWVDKPSILLRPVWVGFYTIWSQWDSNYWVITRMWGLVWGAGQSLWKRVGLGIRSPDWVMMLPYDPGQVI